MVRKDQRSAFPAEVIERLESLERAVQLQAIGKPQAEVDERQANAMAKLIN